MTQRIVILGGGFGGMYAARELRRRLGPDASIELISDENYFVFQPLLPEVAGSTIAPLHAVTPYRVLLPDVKVRKARVHSVDFGAKEITVFQGVQRRPTIVPYDQLVIALGQRIDLSRYPGLTEHGLTMKTLKDARRLRAHVIERLEHADITSLPEVKREALTFTVIGAGFSGIETVGEISELIHDALRYYPGISPDEVRIVVVEYAKRILAEMPDKLAAYAHKQLEKRKVELKLGVGVVSATGTTLTLTNGEVIATRTIVATVGNAPSEVVTDMDLEFVHGKIAVERTMQAKGRADVWALGDAAMIPLKDGAEKREDFAPPTAQFAVREAAQLARNLVARLEGRPLKPFDYESQGAMASLGAHTGIGVVKGVKVKGFIGWLLWRAYYLSFLPGFGTKVRVLVNWLTDYFTPRNIVQLEAQKPPAVRHAFYRAGDRVYEEGNRADGFYTVLTGRFEVRVETPEGATVREVGPGDHFGERMIMGEATRKATVRALEDGQVLVLDRDEFMMLAEGFDAFSDYFKGYIKETFGIDWTPPQA